jgi:hypothetical protein
MAPEDVKKRRWSPRLGSMTDGHAFGLKNATNTFTRTMSVFKEMGDKFLKVFVDDLNIPSENWEDHLQHLGAVLSRLREVNLKLNPSKCCFATGSIVFLGHVVSKEGTKPDLGKIDAVLRFQNQTRLPTSNPFWD